MSAQWGEPTQQVGLAAVKNADEVGIVPVDYLVFSGYVTLAYSWLRTVLVTCEELDAGSGEATLYEAKLATVGSYFSCSLSRIAAYVTAIQAGVTDLMSPSAERSPP